MNFDNLCYQGSVLMIHLTVTVVVQCMYSVGYSRYSQIFSKLIRLGTFAKDHHLSLLNTFSDYILNRFLNSSNQSNLSITYNILV